MSRRCELLVPHIAHTVIDNQWSFTCPGIGLHELPQPAVPQRLSDTEENQQ